MEIKEAKAILANECEALIAVKRFRTFDESEMDDYAANIMSYYNNFEELMFAECKTCDQVLAEALEYIHNYERDDLAKSSNTITRPCPYTGKTCDDYTTHGACRCTVADYYNY